MIPIPSPIIAHRGNQYGPDPEHENTMDHIRKAMNNLWEVEVDVWMKDDHLWLGHDSPKEYLPAILLEMDGIWFHCKDIASLIRMQELRDRGYYTHYFFHEKDSVAVTSEGLLWTYPGKLITNQSIAVLPETAPGWDFSKARSICTDYPYKYSEL